MATPGESTSEDTCRRQAPGLAALPGVDHGFTVRGGPRELHLAQRPPPAGPFDDRVLIDNWALALTPHSPDRLALVDQVHGRRVRLDPAPRGPLHAVGEADGLVSLQRGQVVAVRVADCVPVLLAARGPGGAVIGVAALHAGWRGAAAGIVAMGLRTLARATGGAAEDVVAAIGPSICGAHYEVGAEVVSALAEGGVEPESFVTGRSDRCRPLVDVALAVTRQLEAAGVVAIDRIAACTFEDPDLWSHRRDGALAGRQAAWIVRT